ncbi:MAG TPA: heavy metal-associated domain-containing protein [Abditibacteriaceae bacterium]|jgi:mercuric ion binding protein
MKKLILAAALCGLMTPVWAGKDCKSCPSQKTAKTAGKSCCSQLSRTALLKSGAKAPTKSTAKKSGHSAVYSVSAMTCDGCAKGLQAGLTKEKGVSAVQVDFKTKRATLHFNPKQTDAKKLEAAFARKGFPAKLVKS